MIFLDRGHAESFALAALNVSMKQCPYCGKEYPDDAMNCLTDNYPLRPSLPRKNDETLETQERLNPPVQEATYSRYPDYKWTARDAWKCLGFILVLEMVLGLLLQGLNVYPAVHRWNASGFGYFCRRLAFDAAYLMTAAYFARTETFASWWTGFGLNRKPSDYVWFGVSTALIIRSIGHFLLAHHLGKGVLNYDISAFRHTAGPARYFFLAPLLVLAPVFEEAINRGFLYKAFRGSYRMECSMLLIVAWTAVRHWSQYLHWVAAMNLTLLTLVQCYLREKSQSLWDCIFCHVAFNGSLLLVGALP